ncbi:MAG: phenylacetate-CoA oxygenase subunit PaaJ [Saprospiraceae bacterium]|nr:phenylacetate-CoA oxygenase subunit PaaJ [Saprospiraceae bacterium]
MDLKNKIESILETVYDPEVPVLTVLDMGIIREISIVDEVSVIKITPTYTGCPAMQMIEMNIKAAMDAEGINCRIETVLSPAWTTDWMTEKGKEKLKNYGIAPPYKHARISIDLFQEEDKIQCPRCDSYNTLKISEFGSTACKALFRCIDCKEPFDYFKCH